MEDSTVIILLAVAVFVAAWLLHLVVRERKEQEALRCKDARKLSKVI